MKTFIWNTETTVYGIVAEYLEENQCVIYQHINQ